VGEPPAAGGSARLLPHAHKHSRRRRLGRTDCMRSKDDDGSPHQRQTLSWPQYPWPEHWFGQAASAAKLTNINKRPKAWAMKPRAGRPMMTRTLFPCRQSYTEAGCRGDLSMHGGPATRQR